MNVILLLSKFKEGPKDFSIVDRCWNVGAKVAVSYDNSDTQGSS